MSASAVRAEAAPLAVRPRPVRRARAQRRVAGGVVWIVVVAALLAGIVALNVAVLGLNVEVERLDAQAEKLEAENAALASEISRAGAAGRIEAAATAKLGLVPPVERTYVRLDRKRG